MSKSLTKVDIALSQLDVALSFYLEGREFISAVTLAGAADEILGKLCESLEKPSSLSRRAESGRALYRHLFKDDPGRKVFVDVKNKTRNEFKHLISGAAIQIDLEAETGRMLARAVQNYTTLFGSETPKMRRFQRKRLAPYVMHGV